MSSTHTIINGFGRQKVFPPVGRCIYCFATGRDLRDEHIIPQALGGNIVLRSASCRDCERIVGAQLEGKLCHKEHGFFASARLRLKYKSKRPKERPATLPFRITGLDGVSRVVDVPAAKAPLCVGGFLTLDSPGIIIGRKPEDDTLASQWFGCRPDDFTAFAAPGETVTLSTKPGILRMLARMLAKIGHSMAVAE